MSRRATVIAAFVLAVITCLSLHRGAVPHLAFHVGLYPEQDEKKVIEQTIKLFNVNFATFFNTGGTTEGLNEFPAANLVKRRVFQDIDSLKRSGNLIVYDRDAAKTTRIKLLDSDRAVAETEETWFLSLQDAGTRRPVSAVKASRIKVRYLLASSTGRWVVEDYNVFGKDDTMSMLPVKDF